MTNLKEIITKLENNDYMIYTDNRKKDYPIGCIAWCNDQFNQKAMNYKLEHTNLATYMHGFGIEIDFSDIVDEYWKAHSHKPKDISFEVILFNSSDD